MVVKAFIVRVESEAFHDIIVNTIKLNIFMGLFHGFPTFLSTNS